LLKTFGFPDSVSLDNNYTGCFGKILSVVIVPEMLEISAEASQPLRSGAKTAGEKAVT